MRSIDVLVRIMGNANGLIASLRSAQTALRSFGSAAGAIGNVTSGGTRALTNLASSGRTTASVLLSTFLRIQQATGGLGRSFVELGRSVFYISQLANVFQSLAQGAVSLGQSLLMPAATAEQADIAFEGLLGSAQAATNMLSQLRDFAARTPFEFPQLRSLSQKLLGVQIPASQLIPVLTAVGDAVAGIGGGNDELEGVIRAISQIQSKGKLSAEEMQQLAERSIPAWQILADEMGVSTGKLQEMVSDGLVPASQALPALISGLERVFGGQMVRQSGSMLGVLSNIRDRFDTLRTVFGTPVRIVVAEQLQRFLAYISGDDATRRAAALGNAVALGVRIAAQVIETLYNTVVRVFTRIDGVLSRVGGSFAGFVGLVMVAIRPLGTAVSALLSGDLNKAVGFVRSAMQGIGAIIFAVLRQLAPGLFSGGSNTIAAFAQGMISGAARFVYRALEYITGLIADFLRGFSPPKAGPLHTIDRWFPNVLDAYLGSWSDADWSVLDDVTSRVSDYFADLVDAKKLGAADALGIVVGTDAAPGLNTLVAQVIDSIRTTGKANADAMLQIEHLLGSQNEQLFKELQARFEATALDKQIRDLKTRLASLDDPAAEKRLDDAISRAEDNVRDARTAQEARAGREELAILKARKGASDQQKSALERQIAALERQQQLVTNQISGYETIAKLRERELQFVERIFKIEHGDTDDAAEEAKRRADAEFAYQVAIGSTSQKLELYKQKLSGLETGSVDYFATLTQIKQLEDELAGERARAAQEAEEAAKRRQEAEWAYAYAVADTFEERKKLLGQRIDAVGGDSEEGLRLRAQLFELEAQHQKEAEDTAKRLADAQWDLAFATADTAGKIKLLEERRSKLNESDAEYYELSAQILALQGEQEAAAKRVADAQWQYQYSLGTTAERLDLVDQKLQNTKQGTEEWYALMEQRAQLEKQQREEEEAARKEAEDAAKAQAEAAWNYSYAIADNATKMQMLKDKLAGTKEGSVAYYELLGQIADLERQQADENKRLMDEQARDADARADAEFEYLLSLKDTAGQIAMLREKLARTPAGTVEYFQLLGRIHDLEVRAAKEAADGADTRGAAWQNEAGGIGEFIDKVGGLAEEGKKQWDEWIKRFDEGKTKLEDLKKSFLDFFGAQKEGEEQRRHGGEMTGDEPGFTVPTSGIGANLAVIAAALIKVFAKALAALNAWIKGDGKKDVQGVYDSLFNQFLEFFGNPDLAKANDAFDKNAKVLARYIANKLGVALREEAGNLWIEFWKGSPQPTPDVENSSWFSTTVDAFSRLNEIAIDAATDLLDKASIAVTNWWWNDAFDGWDQWWKELFWGSDAGSSDDTKFSRTMDDVESRTDDFKGSMDGKMGDIVTLVGGWWLWLYDYLVGHSVVPDMVNGILKWFGILDVDGVAVIKGMVGSYASGGGGVLGNIWTLQDGATRGITTLVGVYSAGGGGVLGKVYDLRTGFVDGVTDLVGAYSSGGGGVLGSLHGLVTDATGAATDLVGTYSSGGDGLLGRAFGLRTGFVKGVDDLVGSYASGGGGALGSLYGLVTTSKEQVTAWIGVYAAGGGGLLGLAFTLTNGWTGGISSLVGVYASGGGGTLGFIWTLQDSGTKGVAALVGSYTSGGGGALGILFSMVSGGGEAISNFVGSWSASSGGVLGGLYDLWNTLTEKAGDLTAAMTKPFEGARDAIEGVMKGFGNKIIGVLNNVLNRVGSFINAFRGGVNWIAEKLGVTPPFPDSYEAPQVEGLAVGTRNWRGGWARTGEQGREVAILPAGSTSGNMTYLPTGTQVIPAGQSSKMLEQDNIGGYKPPVPPIIDRKDDGTVGPIIPGEILELWAWVRKGPQRLLQEAISEQLELPGAFKDIGAKVSSNILTWGVSAVREVINDFLDKWGLGGSSGGTGGTPTAPPDQPTPGGGDYPTGMGLGAAMAAIIDGGYLTQHFSGGHPGIDIGAGGWPMEGKKWVRALEGGEVVASGYNPSLEGEYIIIRDSRGRQYYVGHGARGSRRFERGAGVGRGTSLMLMGATGQADAPHVHFELRLPSGQSVNPEQVFSGAMRFAKGGIISEPIVGYGLKSGHKYAFGEEGDEVIVPLNQSAEDVGGSLIGMLQTMRRSVAALLDSVQNVLTTNTLLLNLVAGLEMTLARPQLDMGTMQLPRASGSPMASLLRSIEIKPTIIFQGTNLNEGQVARAVKEGIDQALEELWVEIEREKEKD